MSATYEPKRKHVFLKTYRKEEYRSLLRHRVLVMDCQHDERP